MVPKNTRVIRVIEHLAGYAANSFNPRYASDVDGTTGARFDGTLKDKHGSLYVGMPDTEPHLAFFEVMQEEINKTLSGRFRYISKTEARKRAFVYLAANRDLKLVDMRATPALTRLHTVAKVIQGAERLKTRAWARYVRRWSPFTHGLIYSSSAVGGDRHGHAIVLFSDRFRRGSSPLRIASPVHPMDRGEGLRLAREALKDTSIRIAP